MYCRQILMCMFLNSTLGVAVLNDHIYAVGGFDGSCGLNTAEVILQKFNKIDSLFFFYNSELRNVTDIADISV